MEKSQVYKLFDKGTAHEYINGIKGNIGGEPAILYVTDNFFYIQARDGGNFSLISQLADLKTDMYISENIKRVITDNTLTLYRN